MKGKVYPHIGGPELTERTEQRSETPDGGVEGAHTAIVVHSGNLGSSKPHATRPRRNRTANASQLADFSKPGPAVAAAGHGRRVIHTCRPGSDGRRGGEVTKARAITATTPAPVNHEERPGIRWR